ncbi:MAG: phosphoglucosamine mutase [Chloroflexota bacterium]
MKDFFGTDGIRGTVGIYPLLPDFVLKLGQASGFVLRNSVENRTQNRTEHLSIVIGRDTRVSGNMLQQALTAGLLASGFDVIDAGVIPTPGIAWITRLLEANAGAVISASHNPVEQNGIKFFGQNGKKLSEEMENQIEQLLNSPETIPLNPRLGRLLDGQYTHELYIQSLINEHSKTSLKDLKIVIDCANGAASYIAPETFGRMGARVIALHASPTGWNINVNAGSEHVRRWVEEMGMLIQHYQADFGLAFDGDADRVVLVDNEGNLIDGDYVLGMLARYLSDRQQLLAQSVVTTTMRNTGLKTYLGNLGVSLYETPVGDKYVVEKLYEIQKTDTRQGVIGLGGEQSGHIILVDKDHATGDGIRSALYVIRAFLESKEKTMAAFAATIGKTPQIIASAYVGHNDRLDKNALNMLKIETQKQYPSLIEISLRYSGTEPLFRVMLESDNGIDENGLAAIAAKICQRIQSVAGCVGAEIDILNCTRGGILTVE